MHSITKSVLKQNKKYINICAKYINICKNTERPREKYIPSYWLILGRAFGGSEEAYLMSRTSPFYSVYHYNI